ncbi:hypothetical protein SO802_000904 [Lithocarpus litseifolius]|uniref:Uncharacterized protein n=1 Tax=Lithocarpus litseifolius TaxID=425828 RepID=A0AAW2DWU7_9ROSI
MYDIRDTNDWEVDLMADFIHILESNTLSLESEDPWDKILTSDNLRHRDFDFVD